MIRIEQEYYLQYSFRTLPGVNVSIMNFPSTSHFVHTKCEEHHNQFQEFANCYHRETDPQTQLSSNVGQQVDCLETSNDFIDSALFKYLI